MAALRGLDEDAVPGADLGDTRRGLDMGGPSSCVRLKGFDADAAEEPESDASASPSSSTLWTSLSRLG